MANRYAWVDDFEEYLGVLTDILPDPLKRAELRALLRHWLAVELAVRPAKAQRPGGWRSSVSASLS